jgi:hypothetical protein
MSYDYNADPDHQAVLRIEGLLEDANRIAAIQAGALEALVAIGLRVVVALERAPKQVIIVGGPSIEDDKEPWARA